MFDLPSVPTKPNQTKPNQLTYATFIRVDWPNESSVRQWYYLPTPPLGQELTQGQFLSGV